MKVIKANVNEDKVEIKEKDCYYTGVMIGRIIKNLGAVFLVLLRLYRYYHEEVVMEKDDRIRWEKVRRYLERSKVFDEETLRDVISTLQEYRMFESDFNTYSLALSEVRKVMENEIMESVPEEVRNNPFFKEGMKAVLE